MAHLIGLYKLRLLWNELQALKPDEHGFVQFNIRRFKYVHDIDDKAIVPE